MNRPPGVAASGQAGTKTAGGGRGKGGIKEVSGAASPRPAPRRALAGLALLVALLHWLALADNPWQIGFAPAPKSAGVETRVFNTRRIEVPAPAPKAAVQAAALRPAALRAPRPVVQAPAGAAPAAPTPADNAAPASDMPAASTSPAGPLVPFTPFTPLVAAAESVPDSAPPAAPGQSVANAIEAPAPAAPEPAAARAVGAVQIPESVRLKYDMTGAARGLSYHARGVMTWQRDGQRYEASMVVSAFLLGSRSVSSVGEITADGIAPTRFSDKGRNELATHFDAAKGRISFSSNRPDVPWQRGAQDRLSVFFQLAGLLAGAPGGLPAGTKLPIYTAGPREADTWSFTVESEERLKLPMGEVAALKLTRDPRREFDQRIEAWFAPSLGFWPVRIKLTQSNGDYIDQQLASSGPP